MSFCRLNLSLAAFAAAFVLAGCVGQQGHYDTIAKVESDKALLRLYDESLKGAALQRVAFADPWEYEEYVGVDGGGLKAELFYVTYAGPSIALQFSQTIESMVEGWNFNRGRSKSWGEEGSADNPFAEIAFRRYVLTESNRPCVGFIAEWDSPAADPDNRPGKVLFGYTCADSGGALPDSRIYALLENIGIRGITERIPKQRWAKPLIAHNFGYISDGQTRGVALQIAKGGAGASNGNAGFPFELAVPFHDKPAGDLSG